MVRKRVINAGPVRLQGAAAGSVLLLALSGAGPVSAETIGHALVQSYVNNPQLNAQRAATRASDENVPLANAGYLPKASATASVGFGHEDLSSGGTAANALTGVPASSGNTSYNGVPRDLGLTVSQNVFDGYRTPNSVRQAESNVFGSRESLRNIEQSVLQSAAQSYMDVLRDTAVLDLRASNIKVLEEQLRQTQDRFKVGEVTRTDVAQAESGLAGSRADYFTAQSNLQNSIASFRQVVGVQPTRLEPASPLTRGLPPTLESAIAISQVQHPSVQAALHQVDSAALQVKVAEGALYPTVSVNASLTKEYDYQNVPGTQAFIGTVSGNVTIPIYQGGAEYATIRQAKETLTQARLSADYTRENVRAAVISAWGLLESSKATVQADQASVNASEIALNGVREEARVGQRTTLDVLNAQQTLLNARVSLVGAQRDRVVATYAILATIGNLSTATLALSVPLYNPLVHFNQVKDKWFGLRTPDGK